MKTAVTVSLVPEAKGGPFVFWGGLAEACAEAAKLGYDGIEIFPPSAAALDISEITELVFRHKLHVAAIGTGAGWLLHKLSLTDPNPDVRARAVSFIGEIIEKAGKLGAPAIIGSMQGRADASVSRDTALSWLAEGLTALDARAGSLGQKLLYEPLNRYETNLFNRLGDATQFLSRIRTKNVQLLADLFHLNIEERWVPESLQVAGPFIGHVHFADSNRHAMGFGHTDAGPILEALNRIGFKGYVSAEILPLPDSSTAAWQTMQALRKHSRGYA